MYERILVATDGSASAAIAVDRAVEVARSTGASLTVLAAGVAGSSREVVDRELERVAADGVVVDGVVEAGDPASVIVDVARRGRFDLVVLGNVGMTGPRRRFTLGSVPNKVSHALGRSLLLVRTS